MDTEILLKEELLEIIYDHLSDAEAADELNGLTVHVKQDISSYSIKRYLTLVGKRVGIANSADGAAATMAMDDFESFDMSDVAVEAALTAVLDGLIDASLLVDADKTAILAMGDGLTSRAAELGLRRVKPGHVAEARR